MKQASVRSHHTNQTLAFWHDSALPFVESRRACLGIALAIGVMVILMQ